MNMFNKSLVRSAAASAAFALVLSCSLDETADIKLVELGTALEDNICLIEAEGGDFDLSVYSNGEYHVEMISQAPWLTLSSMKGNGDGTIRLQAQQNPDFKRMVSFVLCSDVDSRRDTVYVKQLGAVEAKLLIECFREPADSLQHRSIQTSQRIDSM